MRKLRCQNSPCLSFDVRITIGNELLDERYINSDSYFPFQAVLLDHVLQQLLQNSVCIISHAGEQFIIDMQLLLITFHITFPPFQI